MAQNDKQLKQINYKDYLNTGWGGSSELKNYGIDYSKAEQDQIAGYFKDAATAAYNKTQTDFSNTMASQQASLADTIRRSQAQAVATGASKGMQAANELSAMLGLQQAAAQEASSMQGSYAEALANAEKNAFELQNARNQVMMQGYVADSTNEAQKYVANVEDPYRLFDILNSTEGSGDNTTSDIILRVALSQAGVPQETIQSIIDSRNTSKVVTDPTGNPIKDSSGNEITGVTEWRPEAGSIGKLPNVSFSNFGSNAVNFKDLAAGKSESFTVNFRGKDYNLKADGVAITSENNPKLHKTLTTLSGATNTSDGEMVYYNGKAYISARGTWREVTGQGDNWFGGTGSYDTFMKTLSHARK